LHCDRREHRVGSQCARRSFFQDVHDGREALPLMAAFPTTRWSLIRASDRPPGEIAAAWSDLVRDYRPAILGFFRRSTLACEADDMAQEFLLRSMRDGWWSRADPQFGSFRRFLLMLLKRFVATQRDAAHRRFEMTGVDVAETDHGHTPDRQFDLEFAICLTRSALTELQAEYAGSGRGGIFVALQPWLSEAPAHGELAALGVRLGVAPNTLAVQLKRLRARFQKSVRAALADLSIDAEHAAADLEALRDVLGSEGSA
jgi:DNA-directed RNA polymerase specialized sigma24 family protein